MNIPKRREEALELIKTNAWFSYKELQDNLNLSKAQVQHLFNDKFNIKLKEEFKKFLNEMFRKKIKPKDIIEKYKNIPIQTIYPYYKEWRNKSVKNKVGLSKKQLISRLEKCNFSLNKYRKMYFDSPDKVKNSLKQYGLLDWFYENQKRNGYIKFNSFKKYKKGELKKYIFNMFNNYPILLNKSGYELSKIFDCSPKTANRLKKEFKELQNESN